VTGYLLRNLRATVLLWTLFALAVGCRDPQPRPSGVAVQSDDVSQAFIGKQITVHGKFSLLGKEGPYVTLDNRQAVYLVSKESFAWDPYSQMEGRRVAASGVLRFFHMPPSTTGAEQVPPDYFYFDAKTAQIRLDTH
jgi:hypothetical protein